MWRRNEEVADLLEAIAKLLALKGDNPFRVRAYARAAGAIGAMSEDIEAAYQAGQLDDIPGVGAGIAAKIAEYLASGQCQYFEQLKRQIPVAAIDLLEVPSIGPARAKLVHARLGIATVADLEEAARTHKLRALPGIGARLEERIAREAARVTARTRRLLLGHALPAAEEVARLLADLPTVRAVAPAGSVRRGKETVGDIDLVVSTDRPAAVIDAFGRLPLVRERLEQGPTRGSVLTRNNLQIDLRAVRPDEYGAALLYFTGLREHSIALRTLAQERG